MQHVVHCCITNSNNVPLQEVEELQWFPILFMQNKLDGNLLHICKLSNSLETVTTCYEGGGDAVVSPPVGKLT